MLRGGVLSQRLQWNCHPSRRGIWSKLGSRAAGSIVRRQGRLDGSMGRSFGLSAGEFGCLGEKCGEAPGGAMTKGGRGRERPAAREVLA